MEIKDLAGLSTPANTLIERCADAIGAFAHPYQLVRIANAEAKVEVIKAKAAIEVEKTKVSGAVEIAELQARAIARLAFEQTKIQGNLESILALALPQVLSDAQPENIEEDWLGNFFDKCRLTTDEGIQKLWASILSGEANKPGKYSKRLVNFVQTMSKDEAESFQMLARHTVKVKDTYSPAGVNNLLERRNKGTTFWTPIPISNMPRYNDNSAHISSKNLSNLQDIGLIKSNEIGVDAGPNMVADYFSTQVMLNVPKNPGWDGDGPTFYIEMGKYQYTKMGYDLYSVCENSIAPIPGFLDSLVTNWQNRGYNPSIIG